MAKEGNERLESAFPKGIAKPALRALASAGISHLDQLTKLTEEELLSLHGMGPNAIRVLKDALKAKGKGLAKRSQFGLTT